MKKVFNLLFLFSMAGIIVSCNKNDDDEPTPLRDYAEQYATDLADIEEYLQTHYIESVTNNPGQPDDQDIKLTLIPSGGSQTSIWDQTTYPLSFINVESNDITYKVYYLKMREGTGSNSKTPTNYDSVLAAYKGNLLDDTVFETNNYPTSYFNLGGVIKGWSELFPKFKTGSYQVNGDGTLSYYDFGSGVFFIPSGLAYYNSTRASIPAYSPLIFSVKLYEVQRVDHDSDGIFSYQEDVNGDGYLRDNDTTYEDDTDQDGTPNFLDRDDDGDNYLTKNELKYIINGITYYYPYDGALVDDPVTPQNETYGIPRAFTGPLLNPSLPESETNKRQPLPEDYTDSNRLRRHLDANCKPPYQ
ncbi:FKBP-type peptidyl-prolyl cis-trans isomerase [Flavobacterium sp.]|uniref:FKBP-type peptidyl-prolyl cis-trans isomerase n=1 Tax=Flavobacterium sp. TaxID=239 RepID=UPI002B4B7947|nr:FKBP-type peptidyl-prolyl cis-trans isomerase [Flavobacterium sp.]HLP63830.1 FKBP-type peptidyl-prolyl cis-trans isomerase [Flavobacterium sp.]